ncbi:hypothetical protein [Streptomyces pinistramenti]|nr:hypothetical protein [Streptomyces pinistramenti]
MGHPDPHPLRKVAPSPPREVFELGAAGEAVGEEFGVGGGRFRP